MAERILQIPTKHYIADYIAYCHKTGEISAIHNILILTIHNTNKDFFRSKKKTEWETSISLAVSDRARMSHKDAQLCHDKATYFNTLMANHIRTVIMQKIKVYMKFDKNIKRAIESTLEDLHIDEEHYTYDTIAKYYQRHRQKLNLPSVYNKTFKLCS